MLLAANYAVMADDGGLILGRSHDEGGIFFLVRNGDQYLLEGEVEGYEYILNFGATHQCKKIFDTLNNHALHKTPFFEEYTPAAHIKVLDTRSIDDVKYLIFENGGFGIINKHSTKGYLDSLNQLNETIAHMQLPDGQSKILYRHERPIPLNFYGIFEGNIVRQQPVPTYEPPQQKRSFWERLFGLN